MTYVYQKATEEEKETIYKLYCVVMKRYISQIWGWEDDWQKGDFNEHFKPEEITVVYKDSELIGYSHINIKDNNVFLRMMVIHPCHQRKGIGSKLLDSFISYGDKKAMGLRLEVFKINSGAKEFYEKYGFVAIDKTPASFIMALHHSGSNVQ